MEKKHISHSYLHPPHLFWSWALEWHTYVEYKDTQLLSDQDTKDKDPCGGQRICPLLMIPGLFPFVRFLPLSFCFSLCSLCWKIWPGSVYHLREPVYYWKILGWAAWESSALDKWKFPCTLIQLSLVHLSFFLSDIRYYLLKWRCKTNTKGSS